MEAYKIGKYLNLFKLCNKNNKLEVLTIDQIPPVFKFKKNNLIQKKSINFKNTYKGF